jgi:transposase InsO family protein
MDFIFKLLVSHGYDSIYVVCDHLTRAAHFIPCNKSIKAPELTWLFLDRIFCYHGLPESMISDRGGVFISQFWSELTHLLQVDARTSTAYHPQTDRLTERTNQTLKTYLCAYVSYQQDNWVDYLPLAEFAFNNSENSSTKQSPFFANIGFHPTFEPRLTENTPSTVPAAADLATRLKHIHTELRAELEHAQEVQARTYDRHHDPMPDLQPGRLVWLL